jgi:hypothetical protein
MRDHAPAVNPMPSTALSATPVDESQEDIVELAPEAALVALEKGSIDTQVATAKQYPRSLAKFMAAAREAVTLDPETAAGCFYKLKRKDKNGDEKFIEGPSVRLLEICASAFQNIRYGARVVGIDEKFVVAQGVAHDIENNVYQSIEVRRRITTSKGKRYGDDMIGVTSNAACSIAKRNALNGIVPRVYVNQLMDLAKETAIGDLKTLGERRQKAVAYFTDKLGVPADRVFAYLEVKGLEDMRLVHLEQLTGLRTALREGDTTLEDAFFSKDADAGQAAPTEGTKSVFAGAEGAKKDEPQKADPKPSAESKQPSGESKPAPDASSSPAGENLSAGDQAEPAASTAPKEQKREASAQAGTTQTPEPAGGNAATQAAPAGSVSSADVYREIERRLQADGIPLTTFMAYVIDGTFAPRGATRLEEISPAEMAKLAQGYGAISKILISRLAASPRRGRSKAQ